MANNYELSGTYLEGCSCGDNCLCCAPGGATRNTCHLAAAWQIESGRAGDTALNGLSLVGVYDGACSQSGALRGTLYADEKASPEQRQALESIFAGGRCNHPAGMEWLVQNFEGIRYAAVQMRATGDRYDVEVPGVISTVLEVEPVGTGPKVRTGAHRMEVAEEQPAPRRFAFVSRFRWTG